MRLSTTTDIETDDASATVNQIEETLSAVDYRLSVTSDSVRLFARLDTDSGSVDADSQTMLSELNSLDGVAVEEDDIGVDGRL